MKKIINFIILLGLCGCLVNMNSQTDDGVVIFISLLTLSCGISFNRKRLYN